MANSFLLVCRQQNRLPPICLAFLHRRMLLRGQRADHPRGHPSLRRTDGQVLRQRLRARHHLLLYQGLLHPRRAPAGGRVAGEQQEERPTMHIATRLARGHGGAYSYFTWSRDRLPGQNSTSSPVATPTRSHTPLSSLLANTELTDTFITLCQVEDEVTKIM